MISIYQGVRVDQNTITIDISGSDINALFGIANIAYNAEIVSDFEAKLAEKLMDALIDTIIAAYPQK